VPKPNEQQAPRANPFGALKITPLSSERHDEEQAHAAKLAKWLALAEVALGGKKTTKSK
jgi:hypothetical protein